ncbi:hypothetical protein GCM10023116_35160 [Kistimonas scapharcae]|uniref:HTH lysR-type domain-containing protein n=1 Tax=Kistimonas scapharcae TaxID=1036133 RepID=A0ABP8V6X6_9GAMM
MELEEIYRRDLNLLVALTVLLEENSVSHAAIRLNLSQSAMSRILGRLHILVYLNTDSGLLEHPRHLTYWRA